MSKLKKIMLRARRQVFSEMVGANPSAFKGEGYDFVELREYMSGDDIRYIDWNITAKMQKPYIKIFREERELNVVVVSVLGGSVYFGSKELKQDTIANIVALLGFSALKNQDLFSSYIFSTKMDSFLKPSKNIYQVKKATQNILDFNPIDHDVDFGFIAKTLYKRVKRKSLIIVVGDFFDIPDFRILAKKHEVVSVVVRDRLEEEPTQMGAISLRDPQSGAVFEGDFNLKTAKEYAKKVKEHDKNLYEVFKKHHIRFCKIYTATNPVVGLRKLFEGR